MLYYGAPVAGRTAPRRESAPGSRRRAGRAAEGSKGTRGCGGPEKGVLRTGWRAPGVGRGVHGMRAERHGDGFWDFGGWFLRRRGGGRTYSIAPGLAQGRIRVSKDWPPSADQPRPFDPAASEFRKRCLKVPRSRTCIPKFLRILEQDTHQGGGRSELPKGVQRFKYEPTSFIFRSAQVRAYDDRA